MSWKVRCASSALLVCLTAGALAQVPLFGKWFEEQISRRIQITGWRRLSYHLRSVSGNQDAYDVAEYGGRGLSRFTDFGQVHVSGTKVLGVANFDLNIQDSRFQDPQANRVSLDVERGPWTVNLGDIRSDLATRNRFATFSKSLTGAQVGFKGKRFQAKAVMSEVRGQPRTVSIQGNNTAGPYFLQSSQIVRGSEQILVDGVEQTFGQDYTIDYDLGSVSFVNRQTFQGRIIPPTSTIVATYEVFGFNGTKGRVEAGNASYDFGRMGQFGLTAMRQVQGNTFRNSTVREEFNGPISAGTTIALQSEPQDILTVKVYIVGQLQTLGNGYTFNSANKSLLILLRDVPDLPAALVVEYAPKAVSTVQGDRSVVGFDYRLPFGKSGSLLYSQALGRLTNAASPKSGVARGLELRYNRGPLELTASTRDVPSGFVGIESVGFERNERSQDIDLTLRPKSGYEYGLTHRNSSITTFDQASQPTNARFTTTEVHVDQKPSGKGRPWRLSQSRTTSRGVSGDSTLDTTSFGTSGVAGKMNWKVDLSNQFANGLTTIDSDRQRRRLNLQTLDTTLDYRPGPAWSFNLNSSLSRISTGKDSSLGRDVLFGASFKPSEKFSLGARFADSRAGRFAALGFLGGYGLGYGGNGFSNGSDNNSFTSATDATTASLNANYEPSEKLSLNASLTRYRSSGGLSSNTQTTGLGLGGDWRFDGHHDLNFLFDTSSTEFVETSLRSSATTMSLFLTGDPPGRFSYRGGVNVLLTGGNSQFNQDSLAYEASLSYRLGPRHNLNFSVSNGSLAGYLPQTTRDVSLTYQYRIWRSLALNVGYRILNVVGNSPEASAGAYGSRGFDFELSFDFGR